MRLPEDKQQEHDAMLEVRLNKQARMYVTLC